MADIVAIGCIVEAERIVDFGRMIAAAAECTADFGRMIAAAVECTADFGRMIAAVAERIADFGRMIAAVAERIADFGRMIAAVERTADFGRMIVRNWSVECRKIARKLVEPLADSFAAWLAVKLSAHVQDLLALAERLGKCSSREL